MTGCTGSPEDGREGTWALLSSPRSSSGRGAAKRLRPLHKAGACTARGARDPHAAARKLPPRGGDRLPLRTRSAAWWPTGTLAAPARTSPRRRLRPEAGGGTWRKQLSQGRRTELPVTSSPLPSLGWKGPGRRRRRRQPWSQPLPVAYPSDSGSPDSRRRVPSARAVTKAAVSTEDLKSAARAHWRPGAAEPGRASSAPAPPPPRSLSAPHWSGGGGAPSFPRALSPPRVSFRRRRRRCRSTEPAARA